jgi:hypothetical protein
MDVTTEIIGLEIQPGDIISLTDYEADRQVRITMRVVSIQRLCDLRYLMDANGRIVTVHDLEPVLKASE